MEIIYLFLKNGCKSTNFKRSSNLLIVFSQKIKIGKPGKLKVYFAVLSNDAGGFAKSSIRR